MHALRPIAQVSETRRHMNTDFELQVYVTDLSELARAESAVTQVHEQIHALEQLLSEFVANSPVAQFNAEAAVGQSVNWSAYRFRALAELLTLATEIETLTQRSFSHWFKSGNTATASPPAHWDPQTRTLTKLHKQAHLGFGAIGKGFALDQAAQALHAQGFENWLLQAGGSSVLLQGLPPRSQNGWRVSLAWKRDADGNLLGHRFETFPNSPRRLALGVSGTLEQGRHVIDVLHPYDDGTGTQIAFPVIAVQDSHAEASAARVDALSTALFVESQRTSTHKEGPTPLRFLRDSMGAALVSNSGELFVTPHWEKNLKILCNFESPTPLSAQPLA